MIELLFIACLKTSPLACEERSLLSLEDSGLMACIMQAQPQLAEWVNTHPNFRVAKWYCRNAEDKEIDA